MTVETLNQNPIINKMIELLANDAKQGKDISNFDMAEYKDKAVNSLFEKMLQFKDNKDDMDILASRVFGMIHLTNRGTNA